MIGRLRASGPTALVSIEPGSWASSAIAAASPPNGIVSYAESLWATSPNEGVVTRYDLQSGEIQAVIELGTDVGYITAGE